MALASITGRPSRLTLVCPTFDPDLRQYTNDFSQENFIGNFQFGKVYRGIYEGSEIVVKIWEKDNPFYKVLPGDNQRRFVDEETLGRYFWIHNIFHPNLPEFHGFTLDRSHGQLAVLYAMNPLDTLHNLLQKGSLSWPERINIAIGIASALEFLHQIEDPLNPPYLLCNLSASHIMIDKDYKPVIYDFSMISGGIVTDRRELTNQYVDGCHGYIDPVGARPGAWSEKCDVFSFGVVLLGLITNKVYTEEDFTSGKPSVHEWAWGEYRQQQSDSGKHNISLVHANIESELLFNSRDGIKLTNLAMRCVEYDPLKRPTMKQGHGNSLGIDQIPPGDPATGLANKLSDGHKAIQVFSYEDISALTEGFSEDNIIGDFQFGQVFRGKAVGKEVTVKIWKVPEFTCVTCEYERRLWDELVLLQHPKFMSHPNMQKLAGYCFEGKQLAVVYDLKPLDTIHNLMVKDDFTWLQRIKVALGFSVLLNFLHRPVPHRIQYLVRNICAAHIILDQDGFPKLLDFGMLAGGILPERRFEKFHKPLQSGYVNYYLHYGPWERKIDVSSFGVILLSLISKRIFVDKEGAYKWAEEEYKARLSVPDSSKSQCSLVNHSFTTERGFNSGDGIKITKLAMQCVDTPRCPTMKKVVKGLMKLHAVRNYGDELGVKEMLS
ncbi:hypothetical protein Tsubulata_050948 [Turnera subulata]|uniref:Protein kinase domain-containing protein n=1 Tax=Turnera subulata TaxID=218843 RepID=A0A9Q0FF39_9ROSI|nr:hypothetical protein Tsubulata_050948 [Turnera subulata]